MKAIHDIIVSFGLSSQTQYRLAASIVVLLLLLVLRKLVLKLVWKGAEGYRIRYQWRKGTSYAAFFLAVLLLGRIWFEEFASIATFLGLLTAGLAIALKDLLVNLAGWLFIVWRRPFEVGDRIQVGEHAGDVIDLRIFQFTLMEIGKWVHADQNTGRIIHVPNGTVFTMPVLNYSRGWFDYIWNEIPILVTFESNWERAKEHLDRIAASRAEHLSDAARKKMDAASEKYMIITPNLDPVVYTSVEESGVLLTIRYLCEPHRRRESTQQMWEDILRVFRQADDIDFAYPTQRFYNNPVEGKPGTTPAAPEDTMTGQKAGLSE